MATMNDRAATIAGLEATGWVQDERAKTSKYKVFEHPRMEYRWLVGGSGALRKCMGSAVAESFSYTGTRYHKALQIVGRRSHGYSSQEQAQADLDYHASGPGTPGIKYYSAATDSVHESPTAAERGGA